jgi:oligopeptide transport system substrate-binding protein
MENKIAHRPRVFLALLLILFSSACQQSPIKTPTPAPIISTATPVPQESTATATSIPMPTSTPTPQPSPTNTPHPSPTSAGYYSNGEAGFSLSHPVSWQVIEEGTSQVVFQDQDLGFVFMVAVIIGDPQPTMDEVLAEFQNSGLNIENQEILPDSEGVLIDGVKTQVAEISFESEGSKGTWKIYYVYTNNTLYLISTIGASETFDQNSRTLERVLNTIHLYPPRFFGLDHDQTLFLLGGDPEDKDLDPARTTSSAGDYVGLLYSGLVRLTPQLQVEPDLAKDWTISPDGLIYTFHLKEGLQFASGRILTAEDVKQSWERAADPKTGSLTVLTYLGDILGVREKLSGESDGIDGVKTLDDLTLQVTLDGPKPYFLAKLTYPTAFVVDTKAIDISPNDWMFTQNASGPYKIREYHAGQAIVFEANEHYSEPANIPYLVFLFQPGGTPISLYEAGRLDLLYLGSEDAVRVRHPDDLLHAEWQSTASLCTTFIQFDVNQPPMDDINVRQAFSQAVDNQSLVERLSEGLDLPAKSYLPPGLPGFSSEHTAAGFDPQAARTALNKSYYAGKMPKIKFTVAGTATSDRQDVTALVQMWKENLGIEVSIEYMDPGTFNEEVKDNHGQMVLRGWCADYPDPENFLDILFHSYSDFNYTGYSRTQVDQMLEKARTQPDPQARIWTYQQVEEYLFEDFAGIPLMHGVLNVLVKPRVKGFVNSPMGIVMLQRLSIDAQQEK